MMSSNPLGGPPVLVSAGGGGDTAVDGAGAKKSTSKGGSSCHQCKSRRNFNALTYCTSTLDKKNKRCRKKFCSHCLSKFYKENTADIEDRSNWRCPSCRKICCCAACRRRKEKESGILSGAKRPFSKVAGGVPANWHKKMGKSSKAHKLPPHSAAAVAAAAQHKKRKVVAGMGDYAASVYLSSAGLSGRHGDFHSGPQMESKVGAGGIARLMAASGGGGGEQPYHVKGVSGGSTYAGSSMIGGAGTAEGTKFDSARRAAVSQDYFGRPINGGIGNTSSPAVRIPLRSLQAPSSAKLEASRAKLEGSRNAAVNAAVTLVAGNHRSTGPNAGSAGSFVFSVSPQLDPLTSAMTSQPVSPFLGSAGDGAGGAGAAAAGSYNRMVPPVTPSLLSTSAHLLFPSVPKLQASPPIGPGGRLSKGGAQGAPLNKTSLSVSFALGGASGQGGKKPSKFTYSPGFTPLAGPVAASPQLPTTAPMPSPVPSLMGVMGPSAKPRAAGTPSSMTPHMSPSGSLLFQSAGAVGSGPPPSGLGDGDTANMFSIPQATPYMQPISLDMEAELAAGAEPKLSVQELKRHLQELSGKKTVTRKIEELRLMSSTLKDPRMLYQVEMLKARPDLSNDQKIHAIANLLRQRLNYAQSGSEEVVVDRGFATDSHLDAGVDGTFDLAKTVQEETVSARQREKEQEALRKRLLAAAEAEKKKAAASAAAKRSASAAHISSATASIVGNTARSLAASNAAKTGNKTYKGTTRVPASVVASIAHQQRLQQHQQRQQQQQQLQQQQQRQRQYAQKHLQAHPNASRPNPSPEAGRSLLSSASSGTSSAVGDTIMGSLRASTSTPTKGNQVRLSTEDKRSVVIRLNPSSLGLVSSQKAANAASKKTTTVVAGSKPASVLSAVATKVAAATAKRNFSLNQNTPTAILPPGVVQSVAANAGIFVDAQGTANGAAKNGLKAVAALGAAAAAPSSHPAVPAPTSAPSVPPTVPTTITTPAPTPTPATGVKPATAAPLSSSAAPTAPAPQPTTAPTTGVATSPTASAAAPAPAVPQ